MLLANTINVLNEKGFKYKVEQKDATLSMAFGLIAEGKKNKVEVVPGETDIQVKVLGSEKSVDEAGLGQLLDTILEIKALQEKEALLVESLKA
ncbi:hypothetical protein CVD28_01705 [Bacillus sp. M6-12]|uniref:hypothetical protein n=1 Tax=Bacillus sp. M6-12 TaxID=2054166 RepID=UPI000C7929DC|nr:hypothetical protein [Bacillus sp. M6-12]PLS19149.1 hypothetical protein CVD28_01705 [Bacillus sp. M6-12]